MHRRDFVLGSPAVLASTACSSPPADDPAASGSAPAKSAKRADSVDPHAGHAEHAGHSGHHHSGDDDTLAVAADCIKAGQVCVQHCFMLIAQGDTGMTDCLRAAHDMVAVTQALLALAAGPSEHLKAQAQVAMAVAERCENECRKHADKHAACKACGECCKRALVRYRTLVG